MSHSKVDLIMSIGRVLRQLDLLTGNAATATASDPTLKEVRNTLSKQQLELAINQIEPGGTTLLDAITTLDAINDKLSQATNETSREAILREGLPRAVKAVAVVIEPPRYSSAPKTPR